MPNYNEKKEIKHFYGALQGQRAKLNIKLEWTKIM